MLFVSSKFKSAIHKFLFSSFVFNLRYTTFFAFVYSKPLFKVHKFLFLLFVFNLRYTRRHLAF